MIHFLLKTNPVKLADNNFSCLSLRSKQGPCKASVNLQKPSFVSKVLNSSVKADQIHCTIIVLLF